MEKHMMKGKRIVFTDRSQRSVDIYLKEISKMKPLTNEEEYKLWTQMQAGDMKARSRLVEANQQFVVSVAKQYLLSGAALEDLQMAGCEGLMKAVDKFDGERGVKFLTYASWYIENEIRKEAYSHIKHNCLSLDEPIYGDEDDKATMADFVTASEGNAPDWQLRHDILLGTIQRGVEKKLSLGHLLRDYVNMMEDGFTRSDFAKKHQLSQAQMKWFQDVVQTEGRKALGSAA